MSKGGILNLEDALETGVSGTKRGAKIVTNAVSDTGKATVSQITGQNLPAGRQGEDAQDIVKSLYAQSDKNTDRPSNKSTNQNSQQPEDNTPQGLEKKKKLEELRQQLHKEVYYDPLVNPSKSKEEERPAEKVEKEKQGEMIELAEKKKKEPPPLVQKTQQRVEKFPGASG